MIKRPLRIATTTAIIQPKVQHTVRPELKPRSSISMLSNTELNLILTSDVMHTPVTNEDYIL